MVPTISITVTNDMLLEIYFHSNQTGAMFSGSESRSDDPVLPNVTTSSKLDLPLFDSNSDMRDSGAYFQDNA